MNAKYFTKEELACKHCLRNGRSVDYAYNFDAEALAILDSIRDEVGFPLTVTSGYRCIDHPVEKGKEHPGEHTLGKAVDIAVSRATAHRLLQVAFAHNVPRIGVSQKGNERFIHLGWCTKLPSPTVWSY